MRPQWKSIWLRQHSPPLVISGMGSKPPSPPPGPPPNFKLSNNGENAGFNTLRRVLQPKNKLPPLTWSSMNPNQVKGTIFMKLNDEKLHDKIDFSFLEENFKIPNGNSSMLDSGQHSPCAKLSSLDSLKVLKSPYDHKLTLLHAIAQVITEQFPDLSKFPDELRCIDAACHVNLESINADIRQLDSMFNMVLQEDKLQGNDSPPSLKNFIQTTAKVMEELKSDLKLGQETYASCVEFYGENPRTQLQPPVFFSYVSNFIKSYQQAVIDLNEKRITTEKKQAAEKRSMGTIGGPKERNGALMNELAGKLNRKSNGTPAMDGDGDFVRL